MCRNRDPLGARARTGDITRAYRNTLTTSRIGARNPRASDPSKT